MVSSNGPENFSRKFRRLYPPKTVTPLSENSGLSQTPTPDQISSYIHTGHLPDGRQDYGYFREILTGAHAFAPPSPEPLITDENRAAFKQKLDLEEDMDPLEFIANVHLIGDRMRTHQETIEKYERSERRVFTNALRDYSGLTINEVKSLIYPMGVLQEQKVRNFVSSLHALRTQNHDLGVKVTYSCINEEGFIVFLNTTFMMTDQDRLDPEGRHVLRLLHKCLRTEETKKTRIKKEKNRGRGGNEQYRRY